MNMIKYDPLDLIRTLAAAAVQMHGSVFLHHFRVHLLINNLLPDVSR